MSSEIQPYIDDGEVEEEQLISLRSSMSVSEWSWQYEESLSESHHLPHEVCVIRDDQTAICTNHKQPTHRLSYPSVYECWGWMFNKPGVIFDLLLDQSELSAIYLNEYELCTKSLFNSCASIKDDEERVTSGDFGNRRDVILFVDQEKESSQNERGKQTQ